MPLCVECGRKPIGRRICGREDGDVASARTRWEHDGIFLTCEITESRDFAGHDADARVLSEIREAAELIAKRSNDALRRAFVERALRFLGCEREVFDDPFV